MTASKFSSRESLVTGAGAFLNTLVGSLSLSWTFFSLHFFCTTWDYIHATSSVGCTASFNVWRVLFSCSTSGQGSLQSCSILPLPRFVCQPHNWDSGTTCYYHLAQQNECESFTCCPLLVRLLQKRTHEMQNTPSSLYTIHGYSCGHLLWKLGLLTPRLTSFLTLAQLAVACSMENQ